jgi:hypothetical protein
MVSTTTVRPPVHHQGNVVVGGGIGEGQTGGQMQLALVGG